MSKRRSGGKAKTSVTKAQRVAAKLTLARREGKAKDDAPSLQPRNDNDAHPESDKKISESTLPKEDTFKAPKLSAGTLLAKLGWSFGFRR